MVMQKSASQYGHVHTLTDDSIPPFSHSRKPLLFSLSLLHCEPPPHSSLPSRPLNLSIFTHCRCCAHASALGCILPCLSPYFPLILLLCLSHPLCIDASENATACRSHCGSQNDSRHSSPHPPSHRPIIHPSFALRSLRHPFVLTLGRCRSSCSPLQQRRPL